MTRLDIVVYERGDDEGAILWEVPHEWLERLAATDNTVKLADLARELKVGLMDTEIQIRAAEDANREKSGGSPSESAEA